MVFNICTKLGEYLPNLASWKKHTVVGSSSRWHELPMDLMEIILPRLDLIDRIRMSIVCKSWGFLLIKEIPFPPQLPWLLFPHGPNCKTLSLCDLSQGKLRDLKLPTPIQGGWCCGSSKGWFIIAREKLLQSELFLFNPISGAYHKLPSLSTLACFDDNYHHFSNPHNMRDFIFRIELSSTDPSNCTVAGIFDSCNTLAFCRVGGESWSIFDNSGLKKFPYDYILFFNETLYILQMFTEEKRGAEYTFRSTDYQVSLKTIPYHCPRPIISDDYTENYDHFSICKESGFWLYLVESSNGQLLLIEKTVSFFRSRYFQAPEGHEDGVFDDINENNEDGAIYDTDKDNEDDYEDDEDDYEDDENYANYDINEDNEDNNEVEYEEDDDNCLKYNKTSKFNISVIDLHATTSCMTRLTSLGNQTIFLSASGSSCVQATDFTGCPENCIYFVEDYSYFKDDHSDTPFVSRESGIFHIDDGRIEHPFPSVELPLQSCMGWFTPNFTLV